MRLPPDFQFSQSSLQDYVDCRQRFYFRHVLKVAWPAIESEPVLENEQAMQRGSLFHNLVRQHILGIPEERLNQMAQDEVLARWWQAYLSHIASKLQGERFPEITLSMPLLEYRLLAKYDLLLLPRDGKAVIYDWKTSTRRKTKRQSLLTRLQTCIYPYLLVQAGTFLNKGQPLDPDQVEMIYWFASAPGEPESIDYNLEQFQRDGQYLEALVNEIKSLDEEDFLRTEREERCKYCTYRSLCERGTQAGWLEEEEAEDKGEIESFDFEDIEEIEF
jgi:CRISPR/Cas system-associated exonuclease Cas4 (RecB family)